MNWCFGYSVFYTLYIVSIQLLIELNYELILFDKYCILLINVHNRIIYMYLKVKNTYIN